MKRAATQDQGEYEAALKRLSDSLLSLLKENTHRRREKRERKRKRSQLQSIISMITENKMQSQDSGEKFYPERCEYEIEDENG